MTMTIIPLRLMVRSLFLAMCLLIFLPALVLADSGNKCQQHEKHERTTFFLVDRSDQLQNTGGLEQALVALKEMIQPGERLVVGVITDKLSDTRIVIDAVRPMNSVWESVLKIRAREKAFNDCFADMQKQIIEQNEKYKTSAIVETLSFVGTVLEADASANKRLMIYSDMVQNSPLLNFFTAKAVDPDASVKKVLKDGAVPKLKGAEVIVAGAGIGVPDDKARKIEQFWRGLFEQSGATVKFYGPVYVSG